MKDSEITKIIIKMGKAEKVLTIDEAKKLFKVLEELFGEKIRGGTPYPYVYPWRPYLYYSTPTITTGGGTITYSADTKGFLE